MKADLSWAGLTDCGSSIIQIEKGQQFHIGDYGRIYDLKKGYRLASEFKATYTSSHEEVAKINEEGIFMAQSVGTTKVTMKYKGEKCSCKIEVVEEGTFKNTKVIEKVKEELEKILQIMPSKVTIKNGFSLLKTIVRYENIIYNQCYSQINHFGFLMESTDEEDEKTQSCKLAIPQAGRYGYLESLLSRYREKHLSLNTRDENSFKIQSVAATANELTIKLKEEISAKQMLAAQITQCQMCSLYTPLEEEQATLHLHIEDEETDDSFVCLAKIVKHSKTIMAIPVEFDYGKNKITYTKVELPKGHTYMLGEKMQWTKGIKFKVK